MATPARKVLEEALALTPEQRLDLAPELLASVDGEPPETWEAAWRAELDDRMREVETGAVRSVPKTGHAISHRGGRDRTGLAVGSPDHRGDREWTDGSSDGRE